MSDLILLKVQNYLSNLANGKGNKVAFNTLSSFARANNAALFRQLSPDEPRGFRLRISNLGRPTCILQAEKLGLPQEPTAYSDRFRNLYGDLVEAAAVLTMKEAGVNIVSEQKQVSVNILGNKIDGTYDLLIAEPNEMVYDVKSASGFTFRNKYKDHNLQNLWEEGDTFGYVTQLYLYSEGLSRPVGGLIVINKENGEWCLVPAPTSDSGLREAALGRATENVRVLTSDAEFKRSFNDQPEFYRKKDTGNRVLHFNCGMCKFRQSCWPNAVELPTVNSKGLSPRKQWYTHIENAGEEVRKVQTTESMEPLQKG